LPLIDDGDEPVQVVVDVVDARLPGERSRRLPAASTAQEQRYRTRTRYGALDCDTA
jgi:hypothetical protein